MPKKYCPKCGETYEYEYDNDHYIVCRGYHEDEPKKKKKIEKYDPPTCKMYIDCGCENCCHWIYYSNYYEGSGWKCNKGYVRGRKK